jgi:hypothetical protein
VAKRKMKNKKLLILLCIPLIIAVMVLPLCSFTTVNTSNYDVYSPSYDVDVEYVYHRLTTTLDEYYYGVIPSFNQFLIGENGELPANRASDYIIVGNDSINYGNSTFVDRIGTCSIYSEDIAVACFTGDFILSGDIFLDGSNSVLWKDDRISFSGAMDPSVNYDITFSGFYYSPDSTYNSFNLRLDNQIITTIDRFIYIKDITDIIYSYLSSKFSSLNNHYIVKYIDCDMVSTDDEEFIYSNVTTTMRYSTKSELQTLFGSNMAYDLVSLRSVVYNNGFQIGYDIGLSNSKDVWGSITDFLTTTIGGFLDMNITPTITISSMLGIILSVTLVVAFLKIFAGG